MRNPRGARGDAAEATDASPGQRTEPRRRVEGLPRKPWAFPEAAQDLQFPKVQVYYEGVIYGASDNPGKIAGCEAVGRPADGSVRGTAARTFRGELPGQDPGRVARAHPCQDLVRAAPLPGSKSVKHTSARTLRGAHRCQDPAWGAPPSPPRASPSPSLSPASALRPSPLSSASRARLARTPWSPSLRRVLGLARPPAAPSPRAPAAAALALPAGPAEAACALCQRAPREPVRADCGHRFCRACVVRFWAEEDGPFPCPECADDCWQRAVEPGRPPLSRRLLALEEAAAAPARDGPASEAALQLLCRADGGPLCAACRMAAGPEPPEWEPRWRKALRGKVRAGGDLCAARPHPQPGSPPPNDRLPTPSPRPHPLDMETFAVLWTLGRHPLLQTLVVAGAWGPPMELLTLRPPVTSVSSQENKGSVEIMRKDLNDARDLHGQAESAAAVWKASGGRPAVSLPAVCLPALQGHVMDRRKKALTDYKKLRAFFAEEEERFLQEADKEEGSPEDEDADPAERFGSLLQAVSELERRHRNLGLSMLLQ
ncbi:hypothetical protein GH733_016524, partial [Mirounga leonina]